MAAGDPGTRKRNYSATAIETKLTTGISSASQNDTTSGVIVNSVSGFPSTLPYTLIIDPDTSKEEVVTVTAATSTTLTITRGQDNTQAQAHSANASVRHGVSAREFKELQTHISARGVDADSALLSGVDSHVHGLVSGDGSVVGSDQLVTLTRKTLTTPTINGATLTGTVTSTASIVVSGAGTITGLSSAGMVASSAAPKDYVDNVLVLQTAQATAAATSATSAAASATAAATSATSAAASATAAATSATSASASATAAATSYDDFDDRYLGSKSTAPTVDNDGNALLTGAIYWNSTSSTMFAWSGSAWVQITTTSSYSAPTLGSTTIASGTTYTNVAGLTINSTTIPTSKTLVVTTDTLAVHAATTSAELAGVISDETGSGALVFATTPLLTTPTINTINASGSTTSPSLWGNVSTGGVSIGPNITSGSVLIAGGTTLTGSVSIASGGGTTSRTVNIGTGTTAGTTTVNIGSSAGATSVVNIAGGVLTKPVVISPEERTTVSATAAATTVNFDAATQGVLYYTSNATANWTLNVRGTSTTTLSSILAVGDSITVSFLVTNGSTAYYQTAFNIDGSAATPKYSGGTAPAAGNASAIDAYTYTIVKTAATPTYTVFGAGPVKYA
jgi:hypothetical protein